MGESPAVRQHTPVVAGRGAPRLPDHRYGTATAVWTARCTLPLVASTVWFVVGVQATMMSASRRSLVPFSTLRAWAVLVLTAFCWQPVRGHTAQADDSAPGVRLTLSRQTVWQGADGWCTFSAEASAARGGISFRCGGGGPFGPASPGSGGGDLRRRALSAAESATLRKLSQAALLFEGGHTGADLSASDLPFEMLVVRPAEGSRSRAAVVLVTTGNATFATGARKALVDWLRRLEAGLRKN